MRLSSWLAALGLLLAPLGAAAQKNEDSPWGVASSTATSWNPAAWSKAMAEAGVTWVRGFEDKPDLKGIAPQRAAGLSMCGILIWSEEKPFSMPVNNLAGFRRHVTEQINRYRGVVKYWEVWNEPPNFTRDVSPASYAKIVAAAYDTAKKIDPSVKIGLAAKSVHVGFLAEVIRAGARGKFDFITLHPYETTAMIPYGWEAPYLGIVSNVRAMLRENDPGKLNVPIWFTEIGIETTPRGPRPITEEQQADTLVKLFVMGIAQGVARIHWFDEQDSEGRTHGLLRGDGTPRPAYRALGQLTHALGVRPKFTGYLQLVRATHGFLFEAPNQALLVTWSKPGSSQSVQLAEAADTLDPTTGRREQQARIEITSRPQILIAGAQSVLAKSWRAAAKRTRPSWDESDAQAVSFRAGAASQGLHVAEPAKIKCAEGSCELDLSGTGGAAFAVDPLFQDFQARPLLLSMTVRPYGHGRAGFNLKYEARKPLTDLNDYGMAGTGSWTYLNGTEPVTLHWSLPDAQFIGKYGINLAIDCDSPEFCNFGVQSVELKRQ